VAYLADVSQGEAALARPNARDRNRGAAPWIIPWMPSRP
jgi:hypothetical protein